jgi:hypothetical protein
LRYIRPSAGVRTAAALTTKRLARYAGKGRRQRNAAPPHGHTGLEWHRPLLKDPPSIAAASRLGPNPQRRRKDQVRAHCYQDFPRARFLSDRRPVPKAQHVAHDDLASDARPTIPETDPLRRTEITALLETGKCRGVDCAARGCVVTVRRIPIARIVGQPTSRTVFLSKQSAAYV